MAKKVVRKLIKLTSQKEAELREVISQIDRHEKAEIVAVLNRLQRAKKASAVSLEDTCRIIKAERERQGLSLADLAERTGIARTAISRLETQPSTNPTVLTLNRLADALGKKLVVQLVDENTK